MGLRVLYTFLRQDEVQRRLFPVLSSGSSVQHSHSFCSICWGIFSRKNIHGILWRTVCLCLINIDMRVLRIESILLKVRRILGQVYKYSDSPWYSYWLPQDAVPEVPDHTLLDIDIVDSIQESRVMTIPVTVSRPFACPIWSYKLVCRCQNRGRSRVSGT